MIATVILIVQNFSWLDWLVAAILVYSVIVSIMKGFVREIMGLGTLVLAVVLAAQFHRNVAAALKDVVMTENLALFLGFSIVFSGTLLAGLLAIGLVTRFVKFAQIQWFDRCLGAAFGFIRGWMLGAIVFLGLTSFNVQADSVRSSALAPYFLPGARVVALVTTEEIKGRFLTGYRAVERWWLEQP